MLDNIVIIAYFLVVFGIGIYHSRRQKETTSEYFLAGHSIGWFAVGASLFSTNISSEHFIGLAGSGASSGLAVGCYEWSASFCLFILGWLFVPYYLKSKVFTMPEFLERRFDSRCRWYLTVVSLIAYVFTKISVHLFAGAILMRSVLGWDYLTTSILLVVATGIYTITGGLKAVIYTDLFQSFVLITGAVVLSGIGLYHIGGFAGLRGALPPDFFHMIKPASDPVYPWVGTIFGTMILGIWYWCTDQSIVQKTLSAKDLENARKGTFFCATLKILPVFILVLPGLIAKALYPTIVTGDNAYPTLVLRLLPRGLVGLMVAALLAALMSAMSSVLNSCSTLITMDIFRKKYPNANEKRLVYVGRVATGVIVVISILWVPLIKYLSTEIYQYLQSVQAYIGAPITATFLVGVLWKRATARAALKPKLKKADPVNRTGCKDGPGADGKDPRVTNPALGRLVTCLNVTMAQFADLIPGFAGGYFGPQNVDSIVIDGTGLEGSYDFTLRFSGAGILNGGRGGGRGGRGGDAGPAPAAAGAGEASDPGGGIALADAVEKQLGIKMELLKRPMPAIVIDHVEQKPTDN